MTLTIPTTISKKPTDTPKGLMWEQPLGTIRGVMEEPGPRFVDPYVKAEREAIQEEGKAKRCNTQS